MLNFQKAFPGLSRPACGRQIQTYLPVSRPGKTSASTFRQWAGSSSPYVCNTWTHDFVCLASTNMEETPTSIQLENLRREDWTGRRLSSKIKMVTIIILDKHLNRIFVGKYKLSACDAASFGCQFYFRYHTPQEPPSFCHQYLL